MMYSCTCCVDEADYIFEDIYSTVYRLHSNEEDRM